MAIIKEKIIDALFPKKCVHCGKWDNFICKNCIGDVVFKGTQDCPECGQITDCGKYCKRCQKGKSLSGATACFYYKDPIIRELIEELKYQNIFAIVDFLTPILIEKIKEEGLEYEFISYVPLSRKRERTRGYNQSALIAEKLSKELGIPIFKGLRKIKETPTQVGLSKKERAQNLTSAFCVKQPEIIEKKEILIIDDVFTSGATLNECAKTLKQSGAKKVWALTIAKE